LAAGVLVVVGSLAEASRRQVAEVVRSGAAQLVSVPAATLLAGPADPAWAAIAGDVASRLAGGADVLVELAAGDHPDLAKGPDLAARLADLLALAAPAIGALVATGGETASTLLGRLGITGIVLLDEVEPGVPFGMTVGARRLPVVTKAGAFGDPLTLRRCLEQLKR
jgi:uncharacterized protein YgbK (DUF1537 family)